MRVAATCLAGIALAPAMASAGQGDREQREARRVSLQYAQCVVARHHERASEAIVSNLPNDVLLKQYSELFDSNCMGAVYDGAMKFGGDLYRYGLADALINAEYAKDGPTSFTDRLPLAHITAMPDADFQKQIAAIRSKSKIQEMEQRQAKSVSAAWLSRYGECVARTAPTEVRYWILTKPDTPEETSRIRALTPAFSSCLNDGTLSFAKPVLRGAVALNYYRLAKATVVPTVGKTS